MSETLQFETRVNLSGLNSGMDQAKSVVQAGAGQMAQAMSRVKVETAALSDAYKQLGQFAAAGNQTAIQAIAEHITATEAAKAAVAALASSEEEETVVLKNNISARMAASAGLNEMTGNMMGTRRAAAALLSTIPGLGAAMQAAFPVFGAVALLEILGQMAEKVHAIADEFYNLRSIENAYHDQLLAHGDEAVQNSNKRLSQLREQRVVEAESQGPKAGRADRGAAAGAGFDIIQDNSAIGEATDNLEKLSATITDYQEKAQQKTINVDGQIVPLRFEQDIKKYQLLLQEAQDNYAHYADVLRTSQSQLSTDEEKEALRQKEAAEAGGSGAAAARLRALENALAQEELINGKSADNEAEYWAKYVNVFAQGTSEYTSVLDKLLSAKTRASQELGQIILKDMEDGQRQIDLNDKVSEAIVAANNRITHEQQEASRTAADLDAAATKLAESETAAARALQTAAIAQEQAFGGTSKLSIAQQTGAVQAQAYADRIAALRKQLADLQNDSTLTDPQKEKRGFDIQSQITQTQGQAGASALGNSTSQAKAFAQPYLTAFNDINNGFLQVTNKMIMGTQSISRDFAQMGANLVVETADAFEKMLANALRFEIQTVLAHQLANTQKIASTTSAAAITSTISAQSALTEITHEAAVAAAKTWAALAGIPIIGPVLGAVGAGAAYAGVLALAAFETGGIIPNTGIAMVHQGEAVLPKSLTNMLMNSATSNSNSSSASVTNNFNGGSDKMFQRQMSRSSEHVVNTVRRGLRRQGKI